MRQFAEEEITLPDGPAKDFKFRADRNPFTRLWFDQIDSGRWRRYVATGPTGSGKTLTGFVIPILYHLFELQETVLVGVPTDDIVKDKWEKDLLPAIKASRFAKLMPEKGQGSRGGKVKSIRFRNGATLRFMTGGGDDKSRSNFHCRVLVVSETDGLDESGESSREADKLSQLEARTSSYGDRAVAYLECTVSTESGRTWQEYTKGSNSRLAIKCPHCSEYVTPEREHLVGWKDAADVIEAGERGAMSCPSCGQLWTESDRHQANHAAVLAHKGQTVSVDGSIVGPAPRTRTLGFRWTAANNLLVTTAHVAEKEWTAAREPDEENAEKKLRQFTWALPHKSDKIDLTALEAIVIAGRIGQWARGVVPADTLCLTVGMDLGGYLCSWTAIAWRPGATPHVIDYGQWEVPREGRAVEHALMLALLTFHEQVLVPGWPVGRIDSDQKLQPAFSLVDSGWKDDVVLSFCSQTGGPIMAAKGFGLGQGSDSDKKTTGSKVIARGERYEMVATPDGKQLVEVRADYWKAWVHQRLKAPETTPSAMTLFVPPPGVKDCHLKFAKHLIAEKQVEQYVAGKGLVTQFVEISRSNHFLDATALACVAGHAAGVRLFEDPAMAAAEAAAAAQAVQDAADQIDPPQSFVNSYIGRH